MTSFACAAWSNQGQCFAGGANGNIYVWSGNSCSNSVKAHGTGMVGAIRFAEGKLYSGGKDGLVKIWDPSSMSELQSIDFGSLIRAIDVVGGQALVGCKNGSIYQVNIASQSK
jgi:WD40 repeat protein